MLKCSIESVPNTTERCISWRRVVGTEVPGKERRREEERGGREGGRGGEERRRGADAIALREGHGSSGRPTAD